jgi:hypothetical protein
VARKKRGGAEEGSDGGGDASGADVFLRAAKTLLVLGNAVRPRARDGSPGGLVELDPFLPCLVLPDLHARPAVLSALESSIPPMEGQNGTLTARDALAAGTLQVVMLGDGPHSEGKPGAVRWRKALTEYLSGWASDEAMREEMGLAFDAMARVALLIAEFPGRFFFLKGNHDNIRNREGGGDHPFGKFAAEGEMAADWTERFMGEAFMNAYDSFERSLPLMARGGGFLACHAEPAFPLRPEDVIDARLSGDVVEALTWTDNDAAEDGSVEDTLSAFLPEGARPGIILGGHRPSLARFSLRSGGRYVQIHDVERMQAALVRPGMPFDPVSGIFDLSPSL